jgi:alpha-2-macroglobulin
MKKKIIIAAIALVALACIVFMVKKCKSERIIVDPGFSEYISAYTSGIISTGSVIKIELTKGVQGIHGNDEIDRSYFDFSPNIEGKAFWADDRTIIFRPDKKLKQNQVYTAEFKLYKIIEVPSKYKIFEFQFETTKQSFTVEIDGYQPYSNDNLKWNYISGTIRKADEAEISQVEKMLTATQNGKELKIQWTHQDNNDYFIIDSVIRANEAGKVTVSWDGSPIEADVKGEKEVDIPSLFDFFALDAFIEQEPEQYVRIKFSDPLKAGQDLSGLITFENGSSFTTEIDRVFIKVYPAVRLSGSLTITVHKGIRNVAGADIKNEASFTILFESIKPGIRLKNNGVIIPSAAGTKFTFEAVNVKAVDVRIIKIFMNNIPYFLQTNELTGERELKRAGRLVALKTVKLNSDKPFSYNKWNLFSIDLSEYIKQDPGAMYRVILSFKKEYSTYPCGDSKNDDKSNVENIKELSSYDLEEESESWDRIGYYYDYDYDNYDYEGGYNWEEREDPCTPSYYRSNNKVSRNVLASDLGIIIKSNTDNTLTAAVTDLISTATKSGVEIEAYNFQNQPIGKGKTNGDGLCTIKTTGKPFLVIAKDGDQRGYVKVDDGTALSVSNFDVSGQTINKGLKGFIYGERGVWRPGDTVFLFFVLEDKFNNLPANHPIILNLYTPQGKLYNTIIRTNSESGFYNFAFNTQQSDPTGNWQANIKIGNTSFSKVLKIETIKPNRLKVILNLGTDLLQGSTISGTITSKWLHGAPAKNLKANVSVTFSTIRTSFRKFEDYVFDDPGKKFETDEKVIFNESLNAEGQANINAAISGTDNAPGMLNANFVTRVFEPGGDFSIDRIPMKYAPYNSFVGVMVPEETFGFLFVDSGYIFKVATLSPEGNPLNRKNIEVKVYRMEWRWWYDSYESEISSFVNNSYNVPVYSKTISTVDGKGQFSFRLNYPDWGRYFLRITDTESGHSTGRILYYDWPWWRGRSSKGDAKGASMLMFTTDKKSYKVGEKVQVTVPSSADGRILVSLENGSEVIKTWWEETKAKNTMFSFEVTEKMAPNVYINLSLIQPYAQTINDLPMRLYGILPIAVDNAASHLNPVITMLDVIRPETPFTVKISEKDRKSMTYTLAIVDEGLLDLTHFKTPDPWTSFYGREALGVKTWDMYDYVLGASNGAIDQLFATGGDEEIRGKDNKKAMRFKPVVKVLGPFQLNSGTNTHEINLPQYVGSVKVMVVAGNKGAYGNAEKVVPVRKPLMILATLPRVLGPGEQTDLPVSIFAMENNIKNVEVKVETNDLLIVDGTSRILQQFDEPGEADISFRIKVASSSGVGRVKVIAKSGSEKAVFDIELDIRNPNSKVVKYVDAFIETGKSSDLSYTLIGTAGTNKATLEASTMPPIDLSHRLAYLIAYPYGCIEQTTSSAFPQLFLDKLVELNSEAKDKRLNNIKYAINRINSMMTYDGGLAYWPGGSSSCDWGTTYGGHFMIEAEKLGFALPSGFLTSWVKYQRKMANSWSAPNNKYECEYQQLMQAYRLYTLALAKEPEFGAMNRLKEQTILRVATTCRLAAAYAVAGQKDVAKKMIENINFRIEKYSMFDPTYGSCERDYAMILEMLVLLDEKVKAMDIVKIVSKALSSDYWYSTQTTAYSLLALGKFVEKTSASKVIKFNFTQNAKTIRVETAMPYAQLNLDNNENAPKQVSISNTGTGDLFVRITYEGIPETGPTESFQNNLKVDAGFFDLEGKPVDITAIEQGTDFVAKVTITNSILNLYITNLALNQVFPSGWEISNMRMDNEAANSQERNYDYQDIRDDRVLTFFDLSVGSTKTFTVKLNASYSGRYYFPGVLCEAMYEPGTNAFVAGKWVEVVKK